MIGMVRQQKAVVAALANVTQPQSLILAQLTPPAFPYHILRLSIGRGTNTSSATQELWGFSVP